MRVTKYSDDIFSPNGDINFITDYHTLGMAIGVKPSTLSYLLRPSREGKRVIDEKVTAVPLKKGRKTYSSHHPLKYVQQRIGYLLLRLQRTLDTDHLWSYKPGFDVYKHIHEVSGAKYFVECDVKKYFDNINTTKIADTLNFLGMQRRGSMLLARYLTVLRMSPSGKPIRTLQQGSKASPYMSNLVGYYYFDRPILQWIEEMKSTYPKAKITYKRYCDNLVMALDGDIPIGLPKEAKQLFIDVILGAKFRYHGLRITPNNHPKKNQKFLGVVLNDKIRIEKEKYEELRATLFNACRTSVDTTASRYFEVNPILKRPQYDAGSRLLRLYKEKFRMVMTGKVANITSINKYDGLALKKLLSAAYYLCDLNFNHTDWTNSSPTVYCTGETLEGEKRFTLHEELFKAVKQYKNKAESVDDYIGRIDSVWTDVIRQKEEETAEVSNSG
jgi:hypothetical protein